MKRKSSVCAITATVLLSAVLTGCATASSAPRESLQIYQPRVLRLPAGQPVQTVEGIYRPQTDETWHSDADYQELERLLINTAAALVQERNRQ
jgi:hypothetical protein